MTIGPSWPFFSPTVRKMWLLKCKSEWLYHHQKSLFAIAFPNPAKRKLVHFRRHIPEKTCYCRLNRIAVIKVLQDRLDKLATWIIKIMNEFLLLCLLTRTKSLFAYTVDSIFAFEHPHWNITLTNISWKMRKFMLFSFSPNAHKNKKSTISKIYK